MKLMHFSDEPIGFWISVEGNGDGWSDWNRESNFAPTDKQYQYSVILSESARILYINSADELIKFTD